VLISSDELACRAVKNPAGCLPTILGLTNTMMSWSAIFL